MSREKLELAQPVALLAARKEKRLFTMPMRMERCPGMSLKYRHWPVAQELMSAGFYAVIAAIKSSRREKERNIKITTF